MIHIFKNKILVTLFCGLSILPAQAFSIARIHYGGGGDWYGDPSSLPNLLTYIEENTSIAVDLKEARIKLTDPDLYSHNFIYITGHGNIRFSEDEVGILRSFLLKGGFLHADDNYGMDSSFRKLVSQIFPDKKLVEIPPDHELFNIYYEFPNGLPKVHKHDGNRPQALALFHDETIIVLYTYESDLGDGWENIRVHNSPIEIHNKSLEMGTNIIIYALSR